MLDMKAVPVNGKDGWRGTIDLERRQTGSTRSVRLPDGREIVVPSYFMQRQTDGSFYVPLSLSELELEGLTDRRERNGNTRILPVVDDDDSDAQEVEVASGLVRVSKVIEEKQEIIDEPLLREEVTVERKPINRVIEKAPPIRYEGETMIIPVVEEVLFVEKRLMLKEELRITRHKSTVNQRHEENVRSEQVIVEPSQTDRTADTTKAARDSASDFAATT